MSIAVAWFISLCLGPVISAQQAFTIAGWGDSSAGLLNVPATAVEISQIAVGEGHALALRTDGQVVAWGRNDAGQTKLPVAPAGGTQPLQFAAIAAGRQHSFAFTNYGLVSWGAVTAVPNLGQVVPRAIAAGGNFNLLLGEDGAVLAAGGNTYGQLNVPSTARSGVIAIAAGDGHVLALRSDGTVVAWGRNDFGQASVPPAAKRIFAIAAGPDFSVALRLDGGVIVWGRGADSVLTPPSAAEGASLVAAGADFITVRTDNGLVTWGASGPLVSAPPELEHVSVMAAGARTLLAVRAPYFTKLPGYVQVRVGEPAELSAEISHTTGINTYWDTKTSVAKTELSYKLASASASNSATHTLTVEYPTGYTMSATGVIVVLSPPRISESSSGVVARNENDSMPLFVNAEGSGPLMFQWRKNGVPIPEATSQFWTVQPIKPSDGALYTCVVSNAAGSAETNPLEIQVLPAKSGRELRPTYVEAGATVALRAVPDTAKAPISDFVWTKNDVVIAGATGPELLITNFSAADAASYWVSFIDGFGIRNRGNNFALKLYRPSGPPYHMWLSPSSAYVKPGSDIKLNLEGVSGYRDPRFRWQIQQAGQPVLIREETNLTSMTLHLATSPDRVNVMVTMEDPPIGVFPAYSNIDVRDAAPTTGQLIRYSAPDELVTGETGSLISEYAPAGSEMIWTKDGVTIPGQNTSTLVISNAKKSDAGIYRPRPAALPNATPGYIEVKIIEQPIIAKHPVSTSLANGPAHLTVEMSVSSPTGYPTTWLRDGVEFWTDSGSTGKISELITAVPGVYQARVYLPSGILETTPATVSTSGNGTAVGIRPGVYLDSRGAVYVRADRTVVVAATIDWKTVGWFGETTIDASGSFVVPRAMRVVADDVPMALDDRLPFSGQISQEGELRAFCGPMLGQTIRTSIASGSDRKREGFFRAKLPGTAGGEIWVFVTADDRASVYLHDGFALYAFPTLNLSSLQFSADGKTVSYGSFPFGPFVAFRESTVAPGDGQLVNLSIRAFAGSGDQTLIAGLVINGSKPRQVLLRAAGPTLTDFGVPGALQDPVLRLFKDGQAIAENNDWGSDQGGLETAFKRLGAFAFKAGSKDAALLTRLSPGVYSAQVLVPSGGAPGEALFEAYDDGGSDPTARLVNLSSRVAVAPGGTIIQGFVVTGTQPKRMLIRAAGPALKSFGVSDALPNPRLSILRDGQVVLENDDWSADPDATARLATIAAQVGAFPLLPGSHDSAVAADFATGVYSVQVRSAIEGQSGVILIELYEAP